MVAAAAWDLPDHWKLGVGEQLRLMPAFLRMFGRHLPRSLGALTRMESGHPKEPHYYLPFVGVLPECRGRGIGAAVLAPVLERCDREELPAYLEASSPRNRPLYERLGFAVTEEITLGKGSPPIWRMWRDPQPASA
jgi:GNAT superfamily N-acetyltransferase